MNVQQAISLKRCLKYWRVVLPLMIMSVFPMQAMAEEIEGVQVPETAMVAGQSLHLNGAGVRTKFFFDIYVGALYLAHSSHRAQQAIEEAGPKRVTMYFLYGEVGRKKLVDGWDEGFEKNQSKKAMNKLRTRLDQFNAMFGDTRKGDIYVFDFLPDGNTRVTLKGQEKGQIQGVDFQQALLAVWLGKHPADDDLKEAMLRGGD